MTADGSPAGNLVSQRLRVNYSRANLLYLAITRVGGQREPRPRLFTPVDVCTPLRIKTGLAAPRISRSSSGRKTWWSASSSTLHRLFRSAGAISSVFSSRDKATKTCHRDDENPDNTNNTFVSLDMLINNTVVTKLS